MLIQLRDEVDWAGNSALLSAHRGHQDYRRRCHIDDALVVSHLVVLPVSTPGDLNEPVGLVINPCEDCSSQQRLLGAEVEALVSLGGKRDWHSSGWFEDGVGTENYVETQ